MCVLLNKMNYIWNVSYIMCVHYVYSILQCETQSSEDIMCYKNYLVKYLQTQDIVSVIIGISHGIKLSNRCIDIDKIICLQFTTVICLAVTVCHHSQFNENPSD